MDSLGTSEVMGHKMTLKNKIKLGLASPSEEDSFNAPRRSRSTGEYRDDHAKVEPEEWQKEDDK